MRNRLVMGAFRYGLMEHTLKQHWDIFGYLQSKVAEYAATGNKELLVDIANMAGLEFMAPSHPLAHWQPLDDSYHCQKGTHDEETGGPAH
jgi:hypothetical protein